MPAMVTLKAEEDPRRIVMTVRVCKGDKSLLITHDEERHRGAQVGREADHRGGELSSECFRFLQLLSTQEFRKFR